MSAPIPSEGGVLGLLKPPGMTSHDAVHTARSLFGTRDIGHAGTLDPLAAGVLPLLFGPATRLSEQLSWPAKTYRAEIVFGIKTDSGDLAGEVVTEIADNPAQVQASLVAAAIAGLTGTQVQLPSPFSARKVAGRKLYEMARRGGVAAGQLRQAAREIRVYAARMLWCGKLGWGRYRSRDAALMEVTCSSGTYVRQLVADVGDALGMPACLSFLVRSACSGFSLADCVTFDDLAIPTAAPIGVQHAASWRRPSRALAFLPWLTVDSSTAQRVGHGIAVRGEVSEPPQGRDAGRATCQPLDEAARGWVAIVDGDGGLVSIGRMAAADGVHPPLIRPKKVFPSC